MFFRSKSTIIFQNHNNCFHIIIIMLTSLSNLDPLKQTFIYIVKMNLQGYISFLFLLKKLDCGYSLEHPHFGGSSEYPQSALKKKKVMISHPKSVIFTAIKSQYMYIAYTYCVKSKYLTPEKIRINISCIILKE